MNIVLSPHHQSAAFYLLSSRLWELVGGGLIAWIRIELPQRLCNVVSVLGLGFVVLAVLAPSSTSIYPGVWVLAPVAAAALLIAAGPTGVINRALSVRHVVYVGLISYPLYLWHFPLLVFARLHAGGSLSTGATLFVVMVSVALAAATYRFIELPVRSRNRQVSNRRFVTLPVVTLGVGMLIVGTFGFLVDNNAGFPSRLSFPIRSLIGFNYWPAPWRVGTCFLGNLQRPSAFTGCVEPGRRPLVFLDGDSHAAGLYPGLEALSGHSFRVAEFTASACPEILSYVDPTRPYCHSTNGFRIEEIRRLRPYEVILGGAWWAYPSVTLEDFARTIAAIRTTGVKRIVVVGDVTRWVEPLQQALFQYNQAHPGRLPTRMSYEVNGDVAIINAQYASWAARLHVGFADAESVLCNAKGCLTRLGNKLDDLTAFDASHITAVASDFVVRALAPQLLPGLVK
jgi:hypothetical protein